MIRLETYDRARSSEVKARQPRSHRLSHGARRPGGAAHCSRTGRSSRGRARLPVRGLRALVRSCLVLAAGVTIGACGFPRTGVPAGAAATSAHRGAAAPVAVNAAATAAAAAPVAAANQPARWVVVQAGDTLWSLAARYGSANRPIPETMLKIARQNHISEDAVLSPGQQIQVWVGQN